MPTLRLTYFDSPGRAEPVRIALFLANVPFEDHRIKFPEFMEQKAAGAYPLGSVPVLEVDGFKMTQTAAMLRYAARLGATNLYPSDPFLGYVVDSAIDTFNDTVSSALTPSMFERDPEKKLAMRKAFAEGPMARGCGYVESLLAKTGGPFVAGGELSIADLVVGETVRQYASGRLDGISSAHLEPYPALRRLGDAYETHPGIVSYRARTA